MLTTRQKEKLFNWVQSHLWEILLAATIVVIVSGLVLWFG